MSTSQGLKIRIGLSVVVRVPFSERREGIVGWRTPDLGDDDVAAIDLKGELVAGVHA